MDEIRSAEDLRVSSRRPLSRVSVVFALLMGLFTLLLCFGIPYQKQLNLIDHIEDLGGIVKTEPVGPKWLSDLL